ncbi:unnamed protein product [Bursaphelenchus xylophilus]|uniref:Copper transport protein n=1 Tax=Bursaphelenchus xylophilus TaxID=6326 RepID=A0A1I7SF75_BURXY|nr:unnamed protein product [Bursaphelenchus xylophilus]CAG9130494.1 unnamed protein product [Bursaphelenchus xylophilus]
MNHSHHDHSQHHHGPVPASSAAHDHSAHNMQTQEGHGMHYMKMYFHCGVEEVILFDWWRTESFFGMLFSCIVVFVMAALYEGVKWVRVYLQTYASSKRKCKHIRLVTDRAGNNDALIEKCTENAATLKSDDVYRSTVTREAGSKAKGIERILKHIDVNNPSLLSPYRILQTTLYCIQLTLAYWLMLIAMTYNIYLTSVVILGAGFGHWMFALLQIQPSLAEKQDAFASDACH